MSAAVKKQPCKNDASFTYSGKESSPLGLGFTANAEAPGTVMEGRDQTMWIIGIRNGVHVWFRVPTEVVANVTKPLMKKEDVLIMEASEQQKPIPIKKRVVATKKEQPPPPPEVDQTNEVGHNEEPIQAPAKKKRAPVKKQPVVVDDEEAKEELAVPHPPPQPNDENIVVPKKRAPAKKKVVVVDTVVPPLSSNDEQKVADPPKKRAPVKKAVEEHGTVAPKKKAPNDFNVYMSFRIDQLKREQPDLDHKNRFKQASNDWNTIETDKKADIIRQARAWADSKQDVA